MAKTPKDPYAVKAGCRLRKVRVALGYVKRPKFAADMSEDSNKVSKWESGAALVPPHFISRLRRMFRIDHNWIYDGDPSGLPYSIASAVLKNDNGD